MKKIKLLINKIRKKYPKSDITVSVSINFFNFHDKSTDHYDYIFKDWDSMIEKIEIYLTKKQLLNRLDKILEG